MHNRLAMFYGLPLSCFRQALLPVFLCLFLFLLSSCSLPHQQAALPLQSPSALTEYALHIGDGTSLPLTCWKPENNATPKAVILALHGFNDYSNAFAMPARYFAEKGILTYAYDQRGFGKAPQAGIWAGQENIERDVIQALKAIAEKHPSVPLYVLGESMGGSVIVSALTRPDFPSSLVKGVILSAPALWGENTLNPLHRLVLWVAAHQLPSISLTGKGLKILASDNMEMLIALSKDPLIIKQTRVDAVYGLVQLMDKAHANITQVKLPTLLMYGHNDQIVPPIALGSVMYQLQQKPESPIRQHMKIAYYDRGWHMLLRDVSRQKVWDDILSWMHSPSAPLPSGEETTPETFWLETLSYREALAKKIQDTNKRK